MDGGDFLLYVFIGCLAFGVFYSVISLIFSGIGSGHDMDHDGIDAGGHGFHGIDSHDIGADSLDVNGGGVDLNHDGIVDADHGGDSAGSPSPFSPLVIASAITAFGAVGLAAMKGFGMSGLLSTIVALAFAGAIGAAIFFGIVKFMYGSQSNSIFSINDLVETEAEVLTPIPEGGFGEIVYTSNEIRYTLPARSAAGESIKRGARVIIREISGNIASVQQKLTLDDIDTFEEVHDNGMSEEEVGRKSYKKEIDGNENEKPRGDAGNTQ